MAGKKLEIHRNLKVLASIGVAFALLLLNSCDFDCGENSKSNEKQLSLGELVYETPIEFSQQGFASERGDSLIYEIHILNVETDSVVIMPSLVSIVAVTDTAMGYRNSSMSVQIKRNMPSSIVRPYQDEGFAQYRSDYRFQFLLIEPGKSAMLRYIIPHFFKDSTQRKAVDGFFKLRFPAWRFANIPAGLRRFVSSSAENNIFDMINDVHYAGNSEKYNDEWRLINVGTQSWANSTLLAEAEFDWLDLTMAKSLVLDSIRVVPIR